MKFRGRCACGFLLRSYAAFILVACIPGMSYGNDGIEPADSRNKTIVLLAVGDIMLSGSATSILEARGYDYPFSDTFLKGRIASSDVAFANLEYPVTRAGVRFENKEYTFRGDPKSLVAIEKAGFTFLSIANNHIMDYGEQGLFATIRRCNTRKLVYAGAGANLDSARMLRKFTKDGIRYGILAYSHTLPEEYWATPTKPGTAHLDWDSLRQDITEAKHEVDILLVSFHWGEELQNSPKRYQVELAHLAINSGADCVLGHHPHVPQPIEIYQGKPIFYSLGNYAFGAFSNKVFESFVAEVLFQGGVPVQVNLYPINVHNREVMFRPRLARGKHAERIIGHLQDISASFGSSMESDHGIGRIFIAPGEGKPLEKLSGEQTGLP